MSKLNFVADIPRRVKQWSPPSWVKFLRRDRWLEVPVADRNAATNLRSQLVKREFQAYSRSVNGKIFVYVRRAT